MQVKSYRAALPYTSRSSITQEAIRSIDGNKSRRDQKSTGWEVGGSSAGDIRDDLGPPFEFNGAGLENEEEMR